MSDAELLSTPEQARLAHSDAVLDSVGASRAVAEGLLAIVDVLDQQVVLRRILTDPGRSEDQRAEMVAKLFDGKADPGAVSVLAGLARLRWDAGAELANAAERQAIRALLDANLADGSLDDVENQLFRFERLVAATPRLRATIEDRRVPLDRRRALVGSLLERAGAVPDVRLLAERAVAARQRTFERTVGYYLEIAAAVRRRYLAHVTVASPLTDEQENRLKAALAKQVGREVDVRIDVDPNVLGGVRVEIGDDVIDGTLQRRLDDVRRKLA